MDKIAVLDFGGQYAHLIANRVRRIGVYSEIIDAETPAEKLKEYKGLIFSGGPDSVYEAGSAQCDPKVLDLGIPILGICYGEQLIVHLLGGKVTPGTVKEFGLAEISVKNKTGIFEGLHDEETVWMSHGDEVSKLPPGYTTLASTPDCEYAAIGNLDKRIYGTQFHLEVTHTKSGMQMLENFINLCGCARDWKIEDFIKQEISTIQQQVGEKKAFMMVSGGVDSTVAFALLEKALGSDRVYGLFVDTGFLRMNEREEVQEALKKVGFNNLHVRDASQQYFEALKGVYEPEQKRKIIGDLFLKVQAEVAEELRLNPEEWLLGQGTIYPDTIETGGTKHAAKIKTHHNRVPQIEALMKQGRIIEPLAQLYKDEVRQLGEKLGLPEKLIWRHPFPGPGLAVRCLCSTGESWPEDHEKLESTIQNLVREHGLTAKILPIQSVGVQGDFRTYRHPLVLIGKSNFDLLGKLATRLINQFKEINRVLWLLSPDEIREVQVAKKYLTPERIALLQQADARVSEFMREQNLSKQIWQFPTVLVPLGITNYELRITNDGVASQPSQYSKFNIPNSAIGESIVLRPVCSEEAMTANFYAMDLELLQKLTTQLRKIPGISGIFYDVTNKPPGTIEWE